jgi:hypothetical protein
MLDQIFGRIFSSQWIVFVDLDAGVPRLLCHRVCQQRHWRWR